MRKKPKQPTKILALRATLGFFLVSREFVSNNYRLVDFLAQNKKQSFSREVKKPSIASYKETLLWSGPVVFWRVRQSQSEVRRFAPRIFDIRSGRKCCVAADGSVVPHGPSRRSRNGCAPPSPAATAGSTHSHDPSTRQLEGWPAKNGKAKKTELKFGISQTS